MKKNLFKILILLAALPASTSLYAQESWSSALVKQSKKGLEYKSDAMGNQIPDFSRVGCYENSKAIPYVFVLKTITPSANDQLTIQTAIDELSARPIDNNGFRGAILLKAGDYKIPGTIKIAASGIILRGEGERTRVIATGKGQRNLISVSGTGSLKEIEGTRTAITDSYVPLGAKSFRVSDAKKFSVGDSIVLFRPGTKQWIQDLQMDKINQKDSTIVQWAPPDYDLHYERIIKKIEGDRIYIDNPVVMAMEEKYGGGAIYKMKFDGRISQVGIEDILCESEYSGNEDEDHGWDAVHFNRVQNSWIINVTSRYFGYSCVNLGWQCRNITVDNCKCLDAKSKIIGGRRYSFNNDGQLNLVMNCFASEGRHDYVTGARVCGPNVFYNCKAEKTHADIGPHHRWATGTLYDNIVTDGEINAQDRGDWGTGHGWSGVNQVFWNCTVAQAAIQDPWVSGKNYVIGMHGKSYNGRLPGRTMSYWEGTNKVGLMPASLYVAQLKERGIKMK